MCVLVHCVPQLYTTIKIIAQILNYLAFIATLSYTECPAYGVPNFRCYYMSQFEQNMLYNISRYITTYTLLCQDTLWHRTIAVLINHLHAYLHLWQTLFFSFWRDSPKWARASSFTRFLAHTQQRRTTVGRTPLVEWSARRWDLYLSTHNNHNRPCPRWDSNTISAGERPQTYALDRGATGIGSDKHYSCNSLLWCAELSIQKGRGRIIKSGVL